MAVKFDSIRAAARFWIDGLPADPLAHKSPDKGARLTAVAGLFGLLLWIATVPASQEANDPTESSSNLSETTRTPPRATPDWMRWSPARLLGGDVMLGAYGGATYTHPSTVEIRNPAAGTQMSVRGFGWEGQPLKSPVYYGLRSVAWPREQRFGAMLDFAHAKAIAKPNDVADYTGTLNGKALPPKAHIRDVFKHLEFSHGHNMVTLNGLIGLGTLLPRVRPYAGLGAGVSLPHTEIGFAGQPGRTYEYQYAGVVGQFLAGIEVRLGAGSLFFEYKFTYAPYEVPLSGVVNGWLLFTDLWRQIKAWTAGEQPPGGLLRTTLITHHGIAGALVRINRPLSP